ncbi:MAG TPA: trypsin-like peptidase domain-containing protein [Gemmataceae bacterium]|nr:trypsin-like peptidase domain-containing protein [Gemmataceae bacterium]
MSQYDSSYDPYRDTARRPVAAVWPLLVLLVGLALLLGGLVYWFWPGRGASGPAQPRTVTPAGKLSDAERATIDLFKAASPSVVHVTNLTETRTAFSLDVQRVERGLGSGFVWDDDGHIITNYHVVEGANFARVSFQDGNSYETANIWTYPDKDIAVLKISAPKSELVPIPVGTSHDLQVGQSTFAIGNPYGLDHTLTTGIVSALGREITSPNDRPIRGVIQTSAAINPGNSGGPLLDSSGRLIGMNSAILSKSGTFGGIGFAIPVDEINRVVPQLINNGKVVRPRLGVQVAEDEQARQIGVKEGALVVRVFGGSPAEAAGLRGILRDEEGRLILGDVIVSIDDKSIKTGKDLFSVLEQYKAGDTVTVAYLRNGQKKEAKVTLQVTA